MLGSITPLGERGRGGRWGTTVAIYIGASTVCGLLFGFILGTLGSAVWNLGGAAGNETYRVYSIGLVALTGVIVESVRGSGRLPSIQRQVNENWLSRYRPWVWAVGFGAQLGIGVVTIITTTAIYALWWTAFVSATSPTGAIVGAAFGFTRAAVSLAVIRVDRPERLVAVDRTLKRLAGPSKRASWVMQLLVIVAAVVAVQ